MSTTSFHCNIYERVSIFIGRPSTVHSYNYNIIYNVKCTMYVENMMANENLESFATDYYSEAYKNSRIPQNIRWKWRRRRSKGKRIEIVLFVRYSTFWNITFAIILKWWARKYPWSSSSFSWILFECINRNKWLQLFSSYIWLP